DPDREDPGRQDARRGAALCAVLTGILVDPELYLRQLRGAPWQTGRRDQDYACLRDSRSCSSAKSILLRHARLTFSRAWNVSFLPNRKSTSAPPTRARLFPVRRRPESQDRDQQRARTTSTSEPERRRAGDMLSSGSGRQASGPSKSRASPLRETPCLMYLVI